MKIATHILCFNQDKWLMSHLEMVGDIVDKIYISYSEIPWSYNKKARTEFKNTFNPNVVEKCRNFDKIEIIKGEWELEEEQRNSCLTKAKNDNMDFLLIIDADEFYTKEDLTNMIENIKSNPQYDYYTTSWVSFWKDFNYIIENDNGDTTLGYPEVAINLKNNNNFIRCRKPSGNKILQMNYKCFHASFVLNDIDCWCKINTWGHSHQFDTFKWYQDKWLKWEENMIDLHPILPSAWKKAVKYNGQYPEILKKLNLI